MKRTNSNYLFKLSELTSDLEISYKSYYRPKQWVKKIEENGFKFSIILFETKNDAFSRRVALLMNVMPNHRLTLLPKKSAGIRVELVGHYKNSKPC